MARIKRRWRAVGRCGIGDRGHAAIILPHAVAPTRGDRRSDPCLAGMAPATLPRTTTCAARRSSSRPRACTGSREPSPSGRRERSTEQPLTVPWRGGALPARKYLPRGSRRRAFLLVPGVHASGVDEPRLIGFARDLASMGHPVLTVGPPDLARYTISPSDTDAIEDAAAWLSQQRDLAPDGRIGMMGISFAGGLSIVAAGRPRSRTSVAAVLSLGGHGELPRTLRYLCTGIQAGRHALAAPRLRRSHHPARRGRPRRASRSGGVAATGAADVPRSIAARSRRQGTISGGVRARARARADAPRTGADDDELRQRSRRRAPRSNPAAACCRARRRLRRSHRRCRRRRRHRSIFCTEPGTT